MDFFNLKCVNAFMQGNHEGWAITIGQHTFYSVPKEQVSARCFRHEAHHKKQWADEGMIKFAVKYLYYLAKYGYYNNPYEVEARKVSETP